MIRIIRFIPSPRLRQRLRAARPLITSFIFRLIQRTVRPKISCLIGTVPSEATIPIHTHGDPRPPPKRRVVGLPRGSSAGMRSATCGMRGDDRQHDDKTLQAAAAATRSPSARTAILSTCATEDKHFINVRWPYDVIALKANRHRSSSAPAAFFAARSPPGKH